MINQAFTQWSENLPVITTLDTITAPIDEIQFPTVTVCDQKPADNWSPVEKLLNSLAFECHKSSYDCKESSEEIRKDFKFLIVSLVRECQKLLNGIDYKTLTEAPMFKNVIEWYNSSGVTDIVAEVMKQGRYEDLEDLAIKIFGTYNEESWYVPNVGK